jgi:hypothetical protein
MVKGGWPTRDRPSKMKAQFESICPECGDEIEEDQTIWWSEHHDAWVCSASCK